MSGTVCDPIGTFLGALAHPLGGCFPRLCLCLAPWGTSCLPHPRVILRGPGSSALQRGASWRDVSRAGPTTQPHPAGGRGDSLCDLRQGRLSGPQFPLCKARCGMRTLGPSQAEVVDTMERAEACLPEGGGLTAWHAGWGSASRVTATLQIPHLRPGGWGRTSRCRPGLRGRCEAPR